MKVAIVAPEGPRSQAPTGGSSPVRVQELHELLEENVDLLHLTPWSSVCLQTASVDIVQVENHPALVLQIRQRLPHAKIVFNIHSAAFLTKRHISQEDAKTALTNSHAIVVNSHYWSRKIKRQFHLPHAVHSHIHVIYPGVNLNKFHVVHSHQSGSFTSRRPFRILYVGPIHPQRGLHVLLPAVEKLHRNRQHVHLTVVGQSQPTSQAYADKLKHLATGLPITFCDSVPPNDLPAYFANADLFVYPAQRSEAFGMVNLEALACGVPILASQVGGIEEIITEECGILIKQFDNCDAWYQQILTVMRNTKRRQRLSRNARKRAERFSWNHTARNYISLYEWLLHSQPETR